MVKYFPNQIVYCECHSIIHRWVTSRCVAVQCVATGRLLVGFTIAFQSETHHHAHHAHVLLQLWTATVAPVCKGIRALCELYSQFESQC